ncbi:MAG: hypothetical protein R3C05_02200 [Pirellulaceae bacterium]
MAVPSRLIDAQVKRIEALLDEQADLVDASEWDKNRADLEEESSALTDGETGVANGVQIVVAGKPGFLKNLAIIAQQAPTLRNADLRFWASKQIPCRASNR